MSTIKKVIIISYNYYPENNPRAFRTTELVKELLNRNINVKVIIPDYKYNYEELYKCCHIKIERIKTGYLFNRNSKDCENKSLQNIKGKKIGNLLVSKIFYLFYLGGKHFEYWVSVFKSLIKEKENYDLLISIGLPISVHIGTSLALKVKGKLANCSIADYGDPFTFNPDNKMSFFHKPFEKWVLKSFDFITVPTEKAISAYITLKDRSKIKVIPQGYALNGIKIQNYIKNDHPVFGYAGIFYENIRNPQKLFEYLTSIDKKFEFHIFTDLNVYENRKCVEPFLRKLKNKIKIHMPIDREKCIGELSKCDFLINVENVSSTQVPSKLIDYYLTGRPVYSFNQNNFDGNILECFMRGNYDNNALLDMDIEKYNIIAVTDKFINLAQKK